MMNKKAHPDQITATIVPFVTGGPYKLLLTILLVQLCLAFAAVAADTTYIFRTSNKTTYCQMLGSVTVPAYVIIDKVRHPGLFIASKPDLDLGRNMKLAPGMVLLTVDGYSMTTSQIADKWLSSRVRNKQIQYTYAAMGCSKPKILMGMVETTGETTPSSPSTSHRIVQTGVAESTDDLDNYLLSLINASRKSEGAAAVRHDGALSRLAQQYADYMADHAAEYEPSTGRSPHTDLQGRSAGDRAHASGITTSVFENIGRASRDGLRSDKSIITNLHQQMMSEPPGGHNHRSTIMDPQSTGVGIGIARSPNRIYLTEEFGY